MKRSGAWTGNKYYMNNPAFRSSYFRGVCSVWLNVYMQQCVLCASGNISMKLTT